LLWLVGSRAIWSKFLVLSPLLLEQLPHMFELSWVQASFLPEFLPFSCFDILTGI